MNIYEIELDYFDTLNLSQNVWKNLIRNKKVFDDDSLFILKTFYQFENHFATIEDIAYVIGMSEEFVELTINNLGQRVIKELNLSPIKVSNEELNYIYMFIKYQSDSTFEIRKNLRIALKNCFPDLNIKFKHIHNKLPILLSESNDNFHFLEIFNRDINENYTIKEIKDFKDINDIKDFKDINDIKDFKDINDIKDINDFKAFKEIEELKNEFNQKWKNYYRYDYNPILMKYNFRVNINKILENLADVSNYTIKRFDRRLNKMDYIGLYGIMDIKNNIINDAYFTSGLSVKFHKYGTIQKNLRISIVQGTEMFNYNNYLPDIWYEVLNHLNFIPKGFETFENKKMSKGVFLYKNYNLEKIDEEALTSDINNIITLYNHILPIYKEILIRLVRDIKNGNKISFIKKISSSTELNNNYPIKTKSIENLNNNIAQENESLYLNENINNQISTALNLENNYVKLNLFDYKKFLNSSDYISLDEFSKEDQKSIIKYNGCGNIVIHLKTKTDEFEEIWLFNNKEDQINPLEKKVYEIIPYEVSPTNNLELIDGDNLESGYLSFDYFDEARILKIMDNNHKSVLKGDIDISRYREITYGDFDEESKLLFKEYRGHGIILCTIVTRIGLNYQEEYSLDNIPGDVSFKDIGEDTVLGIYLDTEDKLIDMCPNQNIIGYRYSFKPFSKGDYDNLKIPPKTDLNYTEKYMKNVDELIQSSLFSNEEIELMFENYKMGVVWYEFKTYDDEIIRDCYRISNIYEEKEVMYYLDDDDAEEYDPNISYMIRLLPYKLFERNDFTVPVFDRIAKGRWFYESSVDFVQLSAFNIKDQEKILESNGCGIIIREVITNDNKSIVEEWVFIDEITEDVTKLHSIEIIEFDENDSSLSLTYTDIKKIKYSFKQYTQEMIDDFLEEEKKNIEDGKNLFSTEDQFNFGNFDEESQVLFKKYAGKGEIIRTVITRSGNDFEEIWEFDDIDDDVLLSNINDGSIIEISSELLDDKLNSMSYPIYDYLEDKFSFKPFEDEKYEELSLTKEFNYEDYMENGSEFIECFEFSDEDNENIEKYRENGLVYYQFKTVNDEIIIDYYKIKDMVKHDVEKELTELGQKFDLSLLSEEEIEEFKQSYDFYDLTVVPYKLGERNNFTVPKIEKFGFGYWHYEKPEDL